MPARHTRIAPQSSHGQLAAALSALRTEFSLPAGFPSGAEQEARTAAPAAPELDLRDLPFLTLDPVGSRDLDQAFHLERRGGSAGFLVRYAIADVPGFVRSGGVIDGEARLRGQTVYLPDGAVPLHPRILSEGRASLLPGEDRTAYVWTIALDEAGEQTAVRLERAAIRSRAQLDYPRAQQAIEAGSAEGPLALLREIGELRVERERARGGASLNMPEEEIVRDDAGYRIERRFPLLVEEWNAQLSLLAGMSAGAMMLEAGIGILRTMPPPKPEALDAFRTRVGALGAPWAPDTSYGDYLRSLDREAPQSPAVLQAAASLFRGAAYAAFDGEPPAESAQAALAAPYAHVTAPLRRLVDRWGLAICAAISADRAVPEWARASLAELPALMRGSGARAAQISSAALDRVEAALLRDRVGERFTAVVLEAGKRARIQIAEPPVTAHCAGDGLVAGERVRVRVVRADVPSGELELAVA
ncbi:RNB domain-containing ribonuclease [Leucobacter weissii]|uniref:RNB domain-containing ribonuclease n=1 Tax=Leucobacter weissii TaxID=1983706 RepID=A0A939MLE8_9MICO|nr:RNB domain-containing ribonuclease [Leucobacter weissii]MBO1900787.1 RNB domain-containing ribonuclease [Leucobacter weissii]